MATYVNNLRLKEIATGDESGTWGTSTNTNLELIGQALGYGTEAITTNADTHATTIADGTADEGRALMLKYTGTLDSTCTITLGPNTVKKVWIIENATSGSQSIVISQGSGDNVTIANGRTAVVYSDGAGSGAAIVDALTDLTVTDSLTVAGTTLTIGDATAEDTKLVFDGNAQDFYIGLDDSADDLVIGLGSAVGTTPAIEIDENQDIKFAQSIGVGQAASSTTGDIVAQTMSLKGTTPTLTIGDAGAEDTKIVFDGNAKDFYVGLDDSADTLVIGDGSTVGTNSILTLTDDSVTIGDGAAVDTKIVYDGNAKDFYIGLDDSADKLVIGDGSTVGTNSILTLTDDSVTIGDGAAVDSKLVFDGNAQDFYIGLDDSEDDLVIGLGSTVGTTPAIHIDEQQVVKFEAAITEQSPNALTSGTSVTLDVRDGSVFTITLAHNIGTFTWSNPATSGYVSSFVLQVTQDGTGGRTISWPSSVDWASATAPTLSTGAADVDIFVFYTIDGGTTYYGFTAGQDMS
jgi:acetyltransferase-like isoleucine patch superfamily enzyme